MRADEQNHQDRKLQSIIERFSRLIEKRYDCFLKWQWNDKQNSTLMEGDDLDHPWTIPLSHSVQKDSLHHWNGNQRFGCVQLYPRHSLSPLQLKEIKELITAIINPTLHLWDQMALLQQEESHLYLNTEKEKSNTSNVISIRSKSSSQFNKSHVNPTDTLPPPSPLPSCLIQASTTVEIHQIALRLHESTQKSYFIHFADLKIDFDKQYPYPLSSLLPLSFLTIFVPEIVQLTPNEEYLLLEWVNHRKNEPHEFQLIVGTIFPYEQILNTSSACRKSLLNLLTIYTIGVN